MYLQYKNGNFDECKRTADKIIELDEANLAAIKLKGTLCLHNGEIDDGIALFESIFEELELILLFAELTCLTSIFTVSFGSIGGTTNKSVP